MYNIKKCSKGELMASMLRLVITELSYLSFKGDVSHFHKEGLVEILGTSSCTCQTVQQVVTEVFSLGE
jgi:hypothetical protein